MVDQSEHGQPARTRYRVVDRAGNRAAWVELQPLTGRTHQLRVHMAAIGHPIVGDGKYGGQEAFLTGSISRKMHLHARRLIIDHPDGAPLDVTAELPEHFAASMAQLGFDEADGAAAARKAPATAARAKARSRRPRPTPSSTARNAAASGAAAPAQSALRQARPALALRRSKGGPTKGKGSPGTKR